MADPFAFLPGQQTVDLSVLVKKTAEASFLSFKELCDTSTDRSDTDKKIGLLKFITKTRQRLLRLLVLTKWCSQIPLVECCQQLVGTLSNHDTSFVQAADSLFFLHEGLQQARAPMYDVPSAVEVLLTGSYRRLPKCIEDIGLQPMLAGEEKESALQKLDTMLRSRLLDVPLPKEITSVKVANGMVTLHVDGEFEAQLTLGYRGNPSLWRVLHLKILVGESSSKLKLTEFQEGGIRDDLERRMAVLDDPFQILYSVLHEFCTAWVMDTIIRQVRALQQGRWKDAIRFDIIQEGSAGNMTQNVGQGMGTADGETDVGIGKSHFSPGLKILYWLDLAKGADVSSLPFLRIEQGTDHHIACSHVPPVIDFSTEYDAQFHINLMAIDVERVILRAILCNIHTRLLDVHRVLKTSSQLCRIDSDVFLHTIKSKTGLRYHNFTEDAMEDIGELGEELLCVRAYGQSFLALGINIRTGKFVLRSHCLSLAPAIMAETEDSLNQGQLTPLDAFISLRYKSLLQLYSTIGSTLNLKVLERGASRFKKSASEGPKLGADSLILSFPNCGQAFYLVLQLDNNFMPILTLIESQPLQNAYLHGPLKIVRYMSIDMGSFIVTEDEVNFCLVNEGRTMQQKEIPSGYNEGEAVRGLLDSPTVRRLGSGFGSAFSNRPDKERAAVAEKGNFSTSVTQPNQFGSVGQNVLNKTLPHNSLTGKSLSGNLSGWSGSRTSPVIPGIGSPGGTASPSRNSPGSIVSPSRNLPYQATTVGPRLMLHTENPPLKSPLNPGESATSPINLDDDDLSKLIDSISSKTAVPTVNGSTFDDGAPLTSPSRQRVQTPLRQSPLCRNSVPNARPSPKSSGHQGGLPRNQVLSPSGSGQSSSPARRSPMADGLGSKIENSSNLVESSENNDISKTAASLESMQNNSLHLSSQTEKPNTDSGVRQKRKAINSLFSLPSLHGLARTPASKKRKINCEAYWQPVEVSVSNLPDAGSNYELTLGQPYSVVVATANEGKAPLSSYTAFFLQVARRCSLCIKQARLTSQMDALNIPYLEEVGLRMSSANLWFRLRPTQETWSSGPKRPKHIGGWEQICLCLGKPGTDSWSVKIYDDYMRELHELQKNKSHSQMAQIVTSEADSHIQCTSEGLVLFYESVKDDSIRNMIEDLDRLWSARSFALGMKSVLEKSEDKGEIGQDKALKSMGLIGVGEIDAMKKMFRIEAIGLTSVWFSYVGSVVAKFVVEWEKWKRGCTIHISPDQLWPHTKYLEDYINGKEVELLLDCIRVTAGPLQALAGAIRPARMPVATAPVTSTTNLVTASSAKNVQTVGQVLSPSNLTVTSPTSHSKIAATTNPGGSSLPNSQNGSAMSGPGRGTGLVPSSLLPTDVLVVLRSPFWIRIVYRRQFAVDMRCFAGDQVWLQPAPPPRGSTPGTKGSLPCPQFRPYVMEQITTGYGNMESNPIPAAAAASGQPATLAGSMNGGVQSYVQVPGGVANRANTNTSASRPGMSSSNQQASALLRVGNPGNLLGPLNSMTPGRGLVPGVSVGYHPSHRELNAAGYGLSDDGGYGGVWVPLGFLKKVLRGTLRYLGVVWLFAQFPGIIKDVLASHLKDGEGALLNHDPETPALRFYIQNCVFAVSVHRQQLVLQAINVKRYPQPPQSQQSQQQSQQSQQSQQTQVPASQSGQPQQQQSSTTGSDTDLSLAEMQEIGDFFARRAAFEPYDASRLASFVTMLTLPVPVLREFIGLIAWKKDAAKAAQHLQATDPNQVPRPKLELCLENRTGICQDSSSYDESNAAQCQGTSPKSSIDFDRSKSIVDFTLTVIFDPIHVPHVNVAGGAGWLPQCVAVRLRYAFGESSSVSLLDMEGSHGGRACWSRIEDWDWCKDKIGKAVESAGSGNAVELGQGRLRSVAEAIQTTFQTALQQLRKGSSNISSPGVGSVQ